MKRLTSILFAIDHVKAIIPLVGIAAVLLANQANAQLKVGNLPDILSERTPVRL